MLTSLCRQGNNPGLPTDKCVYEITLFKLHEVQIFNKEKSNFSLRPRCSLFIVNEFECYNHCKKLIMNKSFH